MGVWLEILTPTLREKTKKIRDDGAEIGRIYRSGYSDFRNLI